MIWTNLARDNRMRVDLAHRLKGGQVGLPPLRVRAGS